MKKSKMFYQAQLSVLRDKELSFEESLEIVKALMEVEDLEKYREKRAEESK